MNWHDNEEGERDRYFAALEMLRAASDCNEARSKFIEIFGTKHAALEAFEEAKSEYQAEKDNKPPREEP